MPRYKAKPEQKSFSITAIDRKEGMLEVYTLKTGDLRTMLRSPYFTQDMKTAFGELFVLDDFDRPKSVRPSKVVIHHTLPLDQEVARSGNALHTMIDIVGARPLQFSFFCGSVPLFLGLVAKGEDVEAAALKTLTWAKQTDRPTLHQSDETTSKFIICI